MATEVSKRGRRETARPAAENLSNPENSVLAPSDIFETEESLFVRIDLPGVEKGNVKIDVDEDFTLQIRARNTYQEPKDAIYREFEVTDYHRSFRVGEGYDKEKISAKLENGVLEIVLPKKEEVKPRRISISA